MLVNLRRHFPPFVQQRENRHTLDGQFNSIEMAEYVNELKDELGQLEQIEVKLLNTHRILTEGNFASSRLFFSTCYSLIYSNISKTALSRLNFLR